MSLGNYLRTERQRKHMSLRDVERATGGEVSNAYLSQLENGKIARPSPMILWALSLALGCSYKDLMVKTHYVFPQAKPDDCGHLACIIDNLTPEEHTILSDYLEFIRSRG